MSTKAAKTEKYIENIKRGRELGARTREALTKPKNIQKYYARKYLLFQIVVI